MTRVVTDATILIHLARLDELALLDDLFDEVLVPTPVYEEVVEEGRVHGYADALAVEDATEMFLDVVDTDELGENLGERIRKMAALGEGEVAAIALAAATDARWLTNDHAARRTATALDVPVGGTIYVFLRALDDGLFTLSGYVDRLDALDDAGFRMSAGLYRRAIDTAEDRVE